MAAAAADESTGGPGAERREPALAGRRIVAADVGGLTPMEAADGAAPRIATGALSMPQCTPALLRASMPRKQVATPAPCSGFVRGATDASQIKSRQVRSSQVHSRGATVGRCAREVRVCEVWAGMGGLLYGAGWLRIETAKHAYRVSDHRHGSETLM